jgi:hypothetical protein
LDPARAGNIVGFINRDPEFKLAARFFSKDILIKVGESKCLLRITDGVLTSILLNPAAVVPWDFFVAGPAESWHKFLHPMPPAFFSDLYGGSMRQKFEFGGDTEAFFAHFWAVTRMMDLMRIVQNKPETA